MSPQTHSNLVLPVIALLVACSTTAAPPPPTARTIEVDVGRGYTPSEVVDAPGEALRLVFTRTTDEGCGQQLVFPDLHIRRDLPLGEPVAVDVTAPPSGRLAFTCGMGMYRGAVVVR